MYVNDNDNDNDNSNNNNNNHGNNDDDSNIDIDIDNNEGGEDGRDFASTAWRSHDRRMPQVCMYVCMYICIYVYTYLYRLILFMCFVICETTDTIWRDIIRMYCRMKRRPMRSICMCVYMYIICIV